MTDIFVGFTYSRQTESYIGIPVFHYSNSGGVDLLWDLEGYGSLYSFTRRTLPELKMICSGCSLKSNVSLNIKVTKILKKSRFPTSKHYKIEVSEKGTVLRSELGIHSLGTKEKIYVMNELFVLYHLGTSSSFLAFLSLLYSTHSNLLCFLHHPFHFRTPFASLRYFKIWFFSPSFKSHQVN